MPRRSRIDAVGALHHVMVRGIVRGKIFGDDIDRNHFIERLEAIKALLKKEKVYQKSHERILGDGDFVSRVLASVEEEMEKRYALRSHGFDLEKVALRVSEVLGVEAGDIWTRGRYRHVVEARSLFCYWSVRELGIPMSSLARRLGISIPAVSKSVTRGQTIAKTKSCSLLQEPAS